MSAAKAPPRRVGAASRRSITPTASKTLREQREEGLLGLGQGIQALLVIARQYADAGAVSMHYPPFAAEVATLADSYEQIAKPVDMLMQLGPFTAVIAAGVPLVMQILANHRMVNASQMVGSGVVPPDVLTAQMEAQIAQMQAQALRDQQAAQEEARKAQREYIEFQRSLEAELAPQAA